MKKKLINLGIGLLAGIMIFSLTAEAQGLWERFVLSIWDTSNNTVKVAFSQSTDLTVTSDLIVGDDATVGGWLTIPPTIVDTTPYTISATGKSSVYLVEYTDTGAASIVLPDTPADGTMIAIQDGDLNAGTNNITIGTAGSDTINEAATFVQNANGESTQMVYSSTNTDWAIIGGYGE